MGVAALVHFEEALDELYAVDFDALSEPDLDEVTIGLARGRCQLLAVSARAIGVWDARGRWRSDGSKAAWARLSREANWSPGEARAEVRRARQLRTMPHTAAALAARRISGAHVDLLGRADQPARHETFCDDEAGLVEHCTTLRYSDARQVVQYWCHRVDPDGCERSGRDLLDKTSLTVATTYGDSVHVQGLLDPVGGAMVVEALRRIDEELRLADGHAGVTRSAAQRRATALVEMARRAMAALPGSLRPEPLVCVVAGNQSMSRLLELSTGAVVSPTLLAPYLEAAQVQGFVFDDAKTCLGVSPQRTFTGWLRRAIQVRDRHCQHPAGCDEPMARCDVDHIVPRGAGGPTSQENGRLQCTTHNRNATLHGLAPP